MTALDPRTAWHQIPSPVSGATAWRRGALTVMIAQEPTPEIRGRKLSWHLSISHPRRYPSWDEVVAARYEFLPEDVNVAMFLPPREEYVNFHETCFHLWETE